MYSFHNLACVDSLAEVEYPRNSGSFSNFESDRSFETCFSGYRGGIEVHTWHGFHYQIYVYDYNFAFFSNRRIS